MEVGRAHYSSHSWSMSNGDWRLCRSCEHSVRGMNDPTRGLVDAHIVREDVCRSSHSFIARSWLIHASVSKYSI